MGPNMFHFIAMASSRAIIILSQNMKIYLSPISKYAEGDSVNLCHLFQSVYITIPITTVFLYIVPKIGCMDFISTG